MDKDNAKWVSGDTRWLNNSDNTVVTGKIMTGQNGTVPDASDISPVGVDYAEWHTISLTPALVGLAPSEAMNLDVQSVAFSVTISSALMNPLVTWGHEIACQSGEGSVPVTFADLVQAGGVLSGNIVFPAGVVEGQTAIVKFSAADRVALLNVTVTA